MGSELFGKAIQRVKAIARIKSLLILPMAALHLAVVQMPNSAAVASYRVADLACCWKTVGEFKAIVCFGALLTAALVCIPLEQPFEKMG